ARFLKEANHLARLDHPRICPIFHFFTEENRTFILMKYVEGDTLKDILDRKGALSIDEGVKITRDLLEALSYAHKKKIYHRDIKPSNIMIDSEGNTVVIDFGIAKSEDDPEMTQEGSFCGTPHFAPPEQFYSSSKIDWALVDIYALGTTLYLLITGEYPYPGQNWMEIAENKRSTDPPRPSSKRPAISAHLDQIVQTSLSRSPGKRYQTAAEMLRALVEAEKDAPQVGADDADFTRTILQTRERAQAKRTRRLWPALLGAGVLALGVSWWIWLRPGPGANTAPALSDLGPYEVSFGNELRFLVVGSDADSDALTLGASGLPSGASFSDNGDNTGSFVWRPDSGQAGAYAVAVSARDQSDTARTEISITVREPGAQGASGAQAAQERGVIELAIAPSADVYVDDSLVAREARGTITAPARIGERVIRLENQNAQNPIWTTRVTVKANQTSSLQHTFAIERPVRTGTVAFTVIPYGDLYIDGELIRRGVNSLSQKLDVGRHVIRVENPKANKTTLADTIMITAGDSINRSYTFDMPAPTGTLAVGSLPGGARIYLNGQLQAEQTPYSFSLAPGDYSVRIESSIGGDQKDTSLTVAAGERYKFIVTFAP
ncbi:MAG: protein kinase, partial [Candidatus Zixiibacteriota bacterium]